MLLYLGRRLVWSLVVLLAVAGLTFYLVHLIPGNPWESRTGQRKFSSNQIDANTLKTLNHRYSLDKPVWQQFVVYLIGFQSESGSFECGFICGNLGPSLRQRGRTVNEILFDAPEDGTIWHSRFAYTMRLAIWVTIAIMLLGIPLGVLAAMKQDTWLDRGISVFSATSMAVPNFIIGLLAIIVFASVLHLISVRATWSKPQDWIIPVIVLALAPAGMLARITRSVVLEASHGDYVRTARSKGLTEPQIVVRHIFKNASIPIITYTGPLLVEFVALSFVIEAMFGFPGFGREYYEAITNLDYPMIMAITMIYGVIIIFANFLIDLLYGFLDPRIRISEQ
jgi:oligopeptide transport system permease protein